MSVLTYDQRVTKFDIFPVCPKDETRDFFYFASKADKYGALNYLLPLSLSEIESNLLASGFSVISKKHGKREVIIHALNQIGVKIPVKRNMKKLGF